MGENLKKTHPMNTSKVTNMEGLFASATSLETFYEMDTSNVTNMASLYNNCWALKDVPKLNTSKATTMNSMFRECFGITHIDWEIDMASCTDCGGMFYRAPIDTSTPIKIKNLNMANITDLTDKTVDGFASYICLEKINLQFYNNNTKEGIINVRNSY